MATDSIPSRKNGGWSDDARGTFGGDEGFGLLPYGRLRIRAGDYRCHAPQEVCHQWSPYRRQDLRWVELVISALEASSYPDNITERAVPMGGEILGAGDGDRFSMVALKRKPTLRAGIWIAFR